jgi:hypothetical protein
MAREADTVLQAAAMVAKGGQAESESAMEVQAAMNGIVSALEKVLGAAEEIRSMRMRTPYRQNRGLEAIERVTANMDKIRNDTKGARRPNLQAGQPL